MAEITNKNPVAGSSPQGHRPDLQKLFYLEWLLSHVGYPVYQLVRMSDVGCDCWVNDAFSWTEWPMSETKTNKKQRDNVRRF